MQKKMMQKNIIYIMCIAMLLMTPIPVKAYEEWSVRQQYEEYEKRYESIEKIEDVEKNGFRIIENQMFSEVFESFGESPLTFFTALDKKYNRLAVFLMDIDGNIVFKTNQLETNYRALGKMKQPTKEIAAVSFIDMNYDNQKDIVLITRCVNETGEYAGKFYKVGDVLFQENGGFYRDYRISEKLNRFGMNKSAKCIISFVRDGKSAEFLYTATTLQQLLEHEFNIIEEQCYARNFEKLGKLQVVPGTFNMGDYNIFMIYLVNEQGNIVWSCQPMADYDSLYSLRGMSYKDLDGDGMKDIAVLARYSYEGSDRTIQVDNYCSIYYQRTGGFDEDRGFAETFQCTSEHRMEDLVRAIRKYWGWQVVEESTETLIIDGGQKKDD